MSTVIDKYLYYIGMKEKEYQTLFIGDENDYRKINKKQMEEFFIKKDWCFGTFYRYTDDR